MPALYFSRVSLELNNAVFRGVSWTISPWNDVLGYLDYGKSGLKHSSYFSFKELFLYKSCFLAIGVP